MKRNRKAKPGRLTYTAWWWIGAYPLLVGANIGLSIAQNAGIWRWCFMAAMCAVSAWGLRADLHRNAILDRVYGLSIGHGLRPVDTLTDHLPSTALNVTISRTKEEHQ